MTIYQATIRLLQHQNVGTACDPSMLHETDGFLPTCLEIQSEKRKGRGAAGDL